MTEQDNTALWTPISVIDAVTYDPARGSIRAKQVTYRLFDGTISHVDIPLNEYNAQTVQERIHTAAMKHAQVMQLQGPPANSDVSQTLPPLRDLVT